jgi:hypothetical protein
MVQLILTIVDVGVQSTLSADLDALVRLEPNITIWAALRRLGVVASVAKFGIQVASIPLAYEVLILQTGGNLNSPGRIHFKVRAQ